MYNGPLPCLYAPMCAFVVLFIYNSCTPLADMCLVLHHYAERRGSYSFWAKPTPLDVQICLQCCSNSSQTASFALATTHTDAREREKYTQDRKQAKRSRSIYRNLQCSPSCVVLRLTPTHKNMKRFVCLGRRGKTKPTQISRLRNIWEQKQSNFTHQSDATQKGRDRKLLYTM